MKPRRWEMRIALCVLGAALAATRTAVARDASGDCPPGDWFCDDDAGDAQAPEPPAEAPEQDPNAPSASPDVPRAAPPPAGMLPGKMKLTSGAPDADVESEQEGPLSPWSVNLRVQGVTLGSGRGHRDAGLGGVGISLRYAFRPSIALDLGLDVFGGIDYNGYDRSETSLSASALWYLNPDRQIRTYLLAGLDTSTAQVSLSSEDQDWTYVGAHAGLGLEFAINERVSLDLDMLGFIRGRTDSRAKRQPEFSDGFGNLTNTSGGGVFRGGVSLYW